MEAPATIRIKEAAIPRIALRMLALLFLLAARAAISWLFIREIFSLDSCGVKLVMTRSTSTVTKMTLERAYMVGWIPRRTSL